MALFLKYTIIILFYINGMLHDNINNHSNENEYKIPKHKNFKYPLIKLDSNKGDSVDIKLLGAYGDNIHDDTEILQLALNNYKKVFLPRGTYLFSKVLKINSNTLVIGEGDETILKAVNKEIHLEVKNTNNILLTNFKIYGNGLIDTKGVVISSSQNIHIKKIWADKMGLQNIYSDPINDQKGGFGFLIYSEDNSSSSKNINITHCKASNIGGGGNMRGDGFIISNNDTSGKSNISNISLTHCSAEYCGRHLFAVSTTNKAYVPQHITINNCSGKEAALCGFDFEAGCDILLSNTIFKDCGNNSKYYDVSRTYGADYRLRAGIATTIGGGKFNVSNVKLINCYYGITRTDHYSKFDKIIIKNSTVSDFKNVLARIGKNLEISNSEFYNSNESIFMYDFEKQNIKFYNCSFYGKVILSQIKNCTFVKCIFNKGITFTNGKSKDINLTNCTFNDFTGNAFNFGFIELEKNNETMVENLRVDRCQFLGKGNLNYGIYIKYKQAENVQIIKCYFENINKAELKEESTNGWNGFAILKENKIVNNKKN